MGQKSEIFTLGGILKRISTFDPVEFRRSFVQRLRVQKSLYLLQAFGLYFGYSFSWYLRGPYSPGLTRDLYSLEELYEFIPVGRFEEPSTEDRFEWFMSLLEDIGDDIRMLELTASAHFIHSLRPSLDRAALLKETIRRKPKTKAARFDRALQLLKKYDLVESDF